MQSYRKQEKQHPKKRKKEKELDEIKEDLLCGFFFCFIAILL